MDPRQLRQLMIHVLTEMGLFSDSAVELLMGTAAQESNLRYIQQKGGGPALGLFQMEPNTEKDIWHNFLIYRYPLRTKIKHITDRDKPGPYLEWDIAYQIVMARVHYMRVPEQLPPAYNIAAIAEYWKKYYNTSLGDGEISDFIINYNKYAGRM